MALIGRLHPLLIHFPIALVIVAAIAEAAATLSKDERWRTLAVANVRAGAAFALTAVIAGWFFAWSLGSDAPPTLEWHRWLGTVAAGLTFVAAFATASAKPRAGWALWMYRIALLVAGIVMAIAAHLGALLVWGADFLRP